VDICVKASNILFKTVLTRIIKRGLYAVKKISRYVIRRRMLGELRTDGSVNLDAYYERVRLGNSCILEETGDGGQSTF
jgi:hypothetical protein